MKDDFFDKKLNIDISDYWLIIRKRFLHILLVFFLVNVFVVAFTFRQRPVYQATCKIKIASRQPMATIEGAQITWYGAKGNEISSEIKLIRNKTEILEAVLKLLRGEIPTESDAGDLNSYYYTDEEIARLKHNIFSEEEKQYIRKLNPGILQNLIEVEPLPSSNLVDIMVKGPFPDVASATANIVALAYRADFWRDKTQEARKTKEFIEKQLNNIDTDLEKNTSSLEKTAAEKVTLGSVEVYQQELTSLRIQLDKLQEKYTASHPRIIKQKKLIATLERQIAKFPKAEHEYDVRIAEREAKHVMRKNLSEHLISAEINFEAKKLKAQDDIQIIAAAEGAMKLKPNIPMNLITGALFGIILALLSAFLWEGLDTSIGKIEDVERITQLPVIAHIPVIGEKHRRDPFFRPLRLILKNLKQIVFSIFSSSELDEEPDFEKKIIFNFSSLSVETEAYRTLRTNIHFALGAKHDGGRVIAITSSHPREGKTLTSTNLAIGLAQMGKATLLIEADMRCPQIAKLFKINRIPGLSDLLIGTASQNDAIRTITDMLMGESEWEKLTATQGIDNLHILPCGTIPPNPSELLISQEFKDLVEQCRQKYDFVIIDTPPSIPVSDSSIIGTVVDGTVLIYQSDKTSRHILLRAIRILQQNEAKLLGIVINQLSFDVIMRSSNSQYYGYGYGVGKETSGDNT